MNRQWAADFVTDPSSTGAPARDLSSPVADGAKKGRAREYLEPGLVYVKSLRAGFTFLVLWEV